MLFPSFCLYCFRPGNSICPACFKKFIPCQKPQKTFWHNNIKTYSFYKYDARTGYLLKKAKYRNWFWLLSEFLESIPWCVWSDWLDYVSELKKPKLLYVPLSKLTQKQRGFNQSQIIASYIGKLFNFPVVDWLIKTKNNQKQSMLKDFKERRKNVWGLYKICAGKPIKNQDLILIDDVLTSGSTVIEIARVLKASGAGKIYASSLFKGG